MYWSIILLSPQRMVFLFVYGWAVDDGSQGLRPRSPPCGASGPTPRGGRVSPPGASDFFDAEKVTKKAPGTPRSPILCPIGLYQIWNLSATELSFVI